MHMYMYVRMRFNLDILNLLFLVRPQGAVVVHGQDGQRINPWGQDDLPGDNDQGMGAGNFFVVD